MRKKIEEKLLLQANDESKSRIIKVQQKSKEITSLRLHSILHAVSRVGLLRYEAQEQGSKKEKCIFQVASHYSSFHLYINATPRRETEFPIKFNSQSEYMCVAIIKAL